MFKSTTDIKKKRPCHTHGQSEKVLKKYLKGSEVLKGDIGNSMIRKHLPRYQSNISTQTDAIQIKSHEVKVYSGRNETETVYFNIEQNFQFSLCCQNTWATRENCRKGMYYSFVKYCSLNMDCIFLDKIWI